MSKRSAKAPRAFWLACGCAALLSACATGPEKPTNELSEETRALYARGLEEMRAGEHEAAIETFDTVSERNDALAGPYANIGIARRALDEPEKAREALQAAIERDPASGAAYNQLGLLHREAGRFKAARDVYFRGIDEHPEYAALHRNLGIMCDIYLQTPRCALERYRAYRGLSEGDDEEVKRWIADVERRVE